MGELVLTFVCHVMAWGREKRPLPSCLSSPIVMRVGELALPLTGCSIQGLAPHLGSTVDLTLVVVAQVSRSERSNT